MAGIIEIRDLAVNAAKDFTAGNFVTGAKKVHTIIGIGLDTASNLGFKAAPESADLGPDPTLTVREAHAALKECRAQCNIVRAESPAVGKLGDGVLLGKLIEAAMKVLELWLKIS